VEQQLLAQWRNRLIFGFILALGVVVGLAFYGDLPRLIEAFRHWRWAYLPFVLICVLANYAVRFLRWHYYLAVIGIEKVDWQDSLGIFLSGFALTMTPGKAGEVLKSFLLKQMRGTPVSYSASIVLVERLTDVVGMVLIASIGLATYRFGSQVLGITLALCVVFVLVVQQQALVRRLLEAGERVANLGRLVGALRNLYDSTYLLLRLKPLAAGIAIATVGWAGECVAFFLVLAGLGVAPTATLALQAAFIYALTTLVGAVSFLPGGLGATEAGMAVLLPRMVHLGRDASAAATMLVRFATLWFAVALGFAALGLFQRRLARRGPPP
jgi:uncharacterized protein (TIRG00374 family)